MAKSVQEQQAWREQKLRFRREEEAISLRWLWTLLPAVQLLVNWDHLRPDSVTWLTYVGAALFLASAAMAVHAWMLTLRHQRAARDHPRSSSRH